MQTASSGGLGANSGPHFDAGQRLALRCVCAWVAFITLLAFAPSARAEELPTDGAQIGKASWYGQEFARRRTASGEEFDPQDLTGAHRTLPLGSKVRVTNLRNGRSVLVTINDRGPYRYRRAIDLSYGAARVLGMIHRGVVKVRIEMIES
jgi:rare lipoprotein A